MCIRDSWEICYNSKKWEKWVGKDFDPIKQKENLIKICGHYVLSNKQFINDIKSQFEDIDKLIKKNIMNKLISLHKTV